MSPFSKIRRFSFITVALLFSSVSQNAMADLPANFAQVCGSNGQLLTNQIISSVIIMGAEHNRTAYIEVNGKIIAQKNYIGDGTGDMASDTLLLNTAIKASILGVPVDLCVPENTKELYGINLGTNPS